MLRLGKSISKYNSNIMQYIAKGDVSMRKKEILSLIYIGVLVVFIKYILDVFFQVLFDRSLADIVKEFVQNILNK